MTGRDPYQLALAALERFAGEGRFGWGAPLVATALAQELALSPTPVREALARLAGEGVIEHRPGRGYFAPSPAPSDIVELYDLHERLVDWALDTTPAFPEAGRAFPEAGAEWPERLFAGLVDASGIQTLRREYRRVAERLRPIRTVETITRPIPDDQRVRLEEAAARSERAVMRREIGRYHEGRRQAAQAVFLAMRAASESIGRI